MPAAGGQQETVQTPPGRIDSPAWSPDGKQIAFMRLAAANARADVYRIAPDGSDLSQVTKGPGSSITPVWSPDGKEFAFTRLVGQRADIYVVDANG